MSSPYTLINECRLCKSSNISTVVNFGFSPLANNYLDKREQTHDVFPLSLCKCGDCHHVQLRETIRPDILFANYLYASSDSPALVSHFHDYAKTIVSYLKLNDNDSIFEIGCNDGVLLREFIKLDLVNVYGAEPAQNLVEKASSYGAKIFPISFDVHLAKEIFVKHGKMSLITAHNVFAHVAELDSMVKGIKMLLTDDGAFVFENAYLLDTVMNTYFDQCYHDHLQYYSVKPLVPYFAKYGLEIFDIDFNKIQGGSFRIFVQHANGPRPIKDSVAAAIRREEEFGLFHEQTFINFRVRLNVLNRSMQVLLNQIIKENKTISCYGCPAKFTLFSQFFNLADKVQYVVDDSPLKQGKFTPSGSIPIVNNQHFKSNPTDYCIISVWNMAEGIMARNQDYKGKFIIPMPFPHIVE